MEIVNCLNSHEYFLRMSVTESNLPESYKIFGKKWSRNLKAWTILRFLGCLVFARVVRKCAFAVTGHAWPTPHFKPMLNTICLLPLPLYNLGRLWRQGSSNWSFQEITKVEKTQADRDRHNNREVFPKNKFTIQGASSIEELLFFYSIFDSQFINLSVIRLFLTGCSNCNTQPLDPCRRHYSAPSTNPTQLPVNDFFPSCH